MEKNKNNLKKFLDIFGFLRYTKQALESAVFDTRNT